MRVTLGMHVESNATLLLILLLLTLSRYCQLATAIVEGAAQSCVASGGKAIIELRCHHFAFYLLFLVRYISALSRRHCLLLGGLVSLTACPFRTNEIKCQKRRRTTVCVMGEKNNRFRLRTVRGNLCCNEPFVEVKDVERNKNIPETQYCTIP